MRAGTDFGLGRGIYLLGTGLMDTGMNTQGEHAQVTLIILWSCIVGLPLLSLLLPPLMRHPLPPIPTQTDVTPSRPSLHLQTPKLHIDYTTILKSQMSSPLLGDIHHYLLLLVPFFGSCSHSPLNSSWLYFPSLSHLIHLRRHLVLTFYMQTASLAYSLEM